MQQGDWNGIEAVVGKDGVEHSNADWSTDGKVHENVEDDW